MPSARSSQKSGKASRPIDGEKKSSLWEALSGTIAAIGTLVGSCAVLVTALHTAGLIGQAKPEQAGKPVQADSKGAAPAKAAAEPSRQTTEGQPHAPTSDQASLAAVEAAGRWSVPEGTLTLAESESRRVEAADADLSLVFQKMGREEYASLHLAPAAGKSSVHLAMAGAVAEFESSGRICSVRTLAVDHANKRATLRVSCAPRP